MQPIPKHSRFSPLLATIGALLYLLTGAACVYYRCSIGKTRALSLSDIKRLKISKTFTDFLTAFCALRVVWMGCELWLERDLELVAVCLNRVAICLFVLAFSYILSSWVAVFMASRTLSTADNQFVQKAWVWANAIFVLSMIISTALFLSSYHEYEKIENSGTYNANVYLIIASNVALGVFFVFFGHRLMVIVQQLSAGAPDAWRKIALLIFLLSVGFLSRAISLLYRPIMEEYMPQTSYMLMGYFIPELPASLYQLYLFHSRQKATMRSRHPAYHRVDC